MACRTASVERVADSTVRAKQQVDKLMEMIKSQEGENKAAFFKNIDAHLADARVTDAREISYNSDIKTEYTSEFSLDKIAAVVVSALKALEKATDKSVKSPATSPEAIEAYTDLVNKVAEAAKSSSNAAASLSFAMNRLSPGVFAFLYASSVNIKDDETFGNEAVTTTAIYYRLMQSIDDVKQEAAFELALIEKKNLIGMKILQAALTDSLADGKLDIDEWSKKDDAYTLAIKKIQARLDAMKFEAPRLRAMSKAAAPKALDSGTKLSEELVRSALQRLSAMGGAYKVAIQASEARLRNHYY